MLKVRSCRKSLSSATSISRGSVSLHFLLTQDSWVKMTSYHNNLIKTCLSGINSVILLYQGQIYIFFQILNIALIYFNKWMKSLWRGLCCTTMVLEKHYTVKVEFIYHYLRLRFNIIFLNFWTFCPLVEGLRV